MNASRFFASATIAVAALSCGVKGHRSDVAGTPANDSSQTGQPITVTLNPLMPEQTAKGTLTLTQGENGVQIVGSIEGLAAGTAHGIHIHEKGDCSAPDGSSAGEHFNPEQHLHGGVVEGSHLGDLGNIIANDAGVANVAIEVIKANLTEGDEFSFLGRAIIVHERADDLTTQPSGGSGAPIACGVIAAPMATGDSNTQQ